MPWRSPIFDFGRFFVRNHEIMQLLRHDHANRWPRIDYSRCCHTQISTRRTQQSTNITLKAAAANLIRSSSRMDEGQAGGALKVGEMMIACLLIIIACMAQYCNYWRKRKSLIDGDIIADVSRRVGAWRRSGRHYIWGGSSIPPLHPTQQSTIYWKRLDICHERCRSARIWVVIMGQGWW